MDLAFGLLIPGSRWSETEKAKVSRLIGGGEAFFPPHPFARSLFPSLSLSLKVPLTAPHSGGRDRGDSRGHHRLGQASASPPCPPATRGKSWSFSWRADLLPRSSFSKGKLCTLDGESFKHAYGDQQVPGNKCEVSAASGLGSLPLNNVELDVICLYPLS